MAFPSYYISSSVTTVDTETTSKILMLPPAASIQGTTLYIYDLTGTASINPIYVSTQTNDRMDYNFTTFVMDTNYQSLRIVPYSSTRYAICQNYTGGLSPFQYAISVALYFRERAFSNRSWQAFATSYDGGYVLAVAKYYDITSDPGFFVSSDYGETFARTKTLSNIDDVRNCCMSGAGQYMYVVVYNDPLGIYGSGNYGQSFASIFKNPIILGAYWTDIDCSASGETVLVITNVNAFISVDYGQNFTLQTLYPDITPTLVACCMSRGGEVYIIATENSNLVVSTDGGSTWTPRGDISYYNGVCCNGNGTIAYASTTAGAIYKSTNSGTDWTLINSEYGYIPVRCSPDGLNVVGADSTNRVFSSVNGGATFTASRTILNNTNNTIDDLGTVYYGSFADTPENAEGPDNVAYPYYIAKGIFRVT